MTTHCRMPAAVCREAAAESQGAPPPPLPSAWPCSLNQSPEDVCRWPTVDSCRAGGARRCELSAGQRRSAWGPASERWSDSAHTTAGRFPCSPAACQREGAQHPWPLPALPRRDRTGLRRLTCSTLASRLIPSTWSLSRSSASWGSAARDSARACTSRLAPLALPKVPPAARAVERKGGHTVCSGHFLAGILVQRCRRPRTEKHVPIAPDRAGPCLSSQTPFR